MLGDTWVLHLLVNPNCKCKGLLTTGFSPEAVCTRVLSRLTSCSSALLQAVSFGNCQSVQFSIITFYVLLLSSSSGNWTLMNIPCVGNVCFFFRIWISAVFLGFLVNILFFNDQTPLFEGKILLCTYRHSFHLCWTGSCWVLCLTFWLVTLSITLGTKDGKLCLKYILSSTRRGNERLLYYWSLQN